VFISKSQRGARFRVCRNPRRVTCACLPSRNHHSNVRFSDQDCSDDTVGIHRYLRDNTKRTKVQYPLSYLSTTSMGITGIENKQTRQNIFSLILSETFTVGDGGPNLFFLSRLLRHALQVTMLLFFVAHKSPGNTLVMHEDTTSFPTRSMHAILFIVR
jgi:hypothetical protein